MYHLRDVLGHTCLSLVLIICNTVCINLILFARNINMVASTISLHHAFNEALTKLCQHKSAHKKMIALSSQQPERLHNIAVLGLVVLECLCGALDKHRIHLALRHSDARQVGDILLRCRRCQVGMHCDCTHQPAHPSQQLTGESISTSKNSCPSFWRLFEVRLVATVSASCEVNVCNPTDHLYPSTIGAQMISTPQTCKS